MKTKYLLPCDCDDPVAVDASQAGLTVECNCGAKLKVPTMRGLAQCERVEQQVAHTPRAWGVDQGVVVLGVVLLLVGLAGGLYARNSARAYEDFEFNVRIDHDAHREDIETMTPSQVWNAWVTMPRSLESIELQDDPLGIRGRESIRDRRALQYRRFSWIGFSVAAAGAAIALTGCVVALSRSRSRAGQARGG